MARFLRINSLCDISPPDLDGHIFRLSLDVGEFVGAEFVPKMSNDFDVTISGTLQAVWGIPDAQLAPPTGSVAAATVVDRVSQGTPNPFEPLRLTTFSAPSKPPDYRIATPGALIPIPDFEHKVEPKGTSMQITSLSDDISAVRDNINTLTKDLLGERLLELPQERPLIDMYREAQTAEQYSSRIQSLAGLVIAINKAALLKSLGGQKTKEIAAKHQIADPNQLAPLVLLEELLTLYSDANRAKMITGVFKRLNQLRQGFPAHGDNADKVLQAHDFFKLRYPVEDFATAWDTILGKYFEAMKEFLKVISDYRHKIANGG